MHNDVYNQIAKSIVERQEAIIGPVAINSAKAVKGLNLNWDTKEVIITSEPKAVIDSLVRQYESLFGQISVEVCKEAVGRLAQQLSPDQLPASLR